MSTTTLADPRRYFEAIGAERMGVRGMRERVHGLGGRFELASSPGLGVCVRAWLPIHEEPAT